MATVPVEITWTTGQVVTAAQLNANVRDAINFLLSPPFAILRQTVGQTLSSSVFAPLTCDVEDIDRDNAHSTVTNTSRYTSQTPGWYSGESLIQIAPNASGRRLSHFTVNGSAVPTGDSSIMAISAGGGNSGIVNSRRAFLNSGDYFEILGFQDGAATLNTNSGSYFSVLWIST